VKEINILGLVFLHNIFPLIFSMYEMRILIDIFPHIWIEEAKMEMRLKEKDGGAYQHHPIERGR
jgi:hypothetical protein